MLICVTGKMGSGKTTFINFLAKQGYEVFEADAYVREIYKKCNVGYNKIIETFGKEYVDEDKVNRQKLGKLVFSDPKQLNKLNEVILPLLVKKIKEIKATNRNVVIELAIYYNYIDKFQNLFDKIVVVKASKKLQDKKVLEKQWNIDHNPIVDPIDKNYIEIQNNGTITDFEKLAKNFINQYCLK